MAEKFLLKGFVELEKKFQKLRGPDLRKVFKDAVKEGAKPMLATAKQIVPVDSGRLRDSLTIKVGRKTQKLIHVLVVPGTREQLNISSDAPGFYPIAIELGSRKRGRPGNKFFRDAMKLEADTSIRIISTRIADRINKAVNIL